MFNFIIYPLILPHLGLRFATALMNEHSVTAFKKTWSLSLGIGRYSVYPSFSKVAHLH